MNGNFQVRTDPSMKTYRELREVMQRADEQPEGFKRYREFKNGKPIDVYEDPLAGRPIRAVSLNRVDLRGKWVIDIDEDPETGEACLTFEDPMTGGSVSLWVPSHLDRTTFVDSGITSARPVEQRPNKRGVDYETIINEKVVPEESIVRRAERVAVKQVVGPVGALLELTVRLFQELARLQRRIGLDRFVSWVRF